MKPILTIIALLVLSLPAKAQDPILDQLARIKANNDALATKLSAVDSKVDKLTQAVADLTAKVDALSKPSGEIVKSTTATVTFSGQVGAGQYRVQKEGIAPVGNLTISGPVNGSGYGLTQLNGTSQSGSYVCQNGRCYFVPASGEQTYQDTNCGSAGGCGTESKGGPIRRLIGWWRN